MSWRSPTGIPIRAPRHILYMCMDRLHAGDTVEVEGVYYLITAQVHCVGMVPQGFPYAARRMNWLECWLYTHGAY